MRARYPRHLSSPSISLYSQPVLLFSVFARSAGSSQPLAEFTSSSVLQASPSQTPSGFSRKSVTRSVLGPGWYLDLHQDICFVFFTFVIPAPWSETFQSMKLFGKFKRIQLLVIILKTLQNFPLFNVQQVGRTGETVQLVKCSLRKHEDLRKPL